MRKPSPLLLCVLALAALLAGCRAVRYVPVETVRTDSVYLNRVQRDSVARYDSIHVREKGDTVTVERYKYVYRDRWRTDTVYVERRDSVPVPCPVERGLTRWERVKLEAGGWAVGIVLAAVAAAAVRAAARWRMRR